MSQMLDNLAREVDRISETGGVSSEEKTTKKEEKDDIQSEKPTSLMGKLLNQNPINFPQVGETIIGKVIEISSNEIYLDLTPFGTGIVLGKEMKDGMGSNRLKIGDEVTASVIELENEDGYIELSIREASNEKAWEDIEVKLDSKEKVSTKILSANKGGLLVEVNGITGFLPVSQLSSKNYPRVEDGDKNKILNLLKKMVGTEMEVRIIDADKETEKLIVSEKAAMSEREKEAISNFKVGDVISGEISGVVDFGAFVKFTPRNDDGTEDEGKDKLEGLVHISELAWQLIEDPRTIIKVGDKVEAKIIGIDNEKISLSIRALQKDPWSDIEEKYKIGDIVKGKVHKINHFGCFVYLDKDIHGLAHISEMSEAFPGKNLNDLVKADEEYDWKILSIEAKTHRMGLVLVDKKGTKKEENNEIEDKKEEKKEDKKEK